MKRKHIHVDKPLVLGCQALFWATSSLLGSLGMSGDGTNEVPCNRPGYSKELEFELEPPGVTYPPCRN